MDGSSTPKGFNMNNNETANYPTPQGFNLAVPNASPGWHMRGRLLTYRRKFKMHRIAYLHLYISWVKRPRL